MLRTSFLTSTAVAALLTLTGCGQSSDSQTQQSQNAQTNEIAAKPAPDAIERTTAAASNEIEQVASPTTQITPAELATGINGENVPNPATSLATAAVKTNAGEALGEVRSVVVGPDGKARAIVVEVGGFLNVGERGVSIEAKKFTYLKDRNILLVALVKSDIEKMPAEPAPQK